MGLDVVASSWALLGKIWESKRAERGRFNIGAVIFERLWGDFARKEYAGLNDKFAKGSYLLIPMGAAL